jgi:L-rhamnose-H+ transport protein
MGKTSYIGWAVLMAASILFSQLLGILLGEWKGTGTKTRSLLAAGLLLLIGSSVLAGFAGSF